MEDWMPCKRKLLSCRPFFLLLVSTLYFLYGLLRNSTRKRMVLHSYSDIGIRLFSYLYVLNVTCMTYRFGNKTLQHKKSLFILHVV